MSLITCDKIIDADGEFPTVCEGIQFQIWVDGYIQCVDCAMQMVIE